MQLAPMVMAARLELGLKELETLVNRTAPGPLVADSKGWRGDKKYKVYRGAIELRRRGREIEWSMPLRIEAAGRTKLFSTIARSCRAAARITMRTRLTVHEDWQVQAKTRPAGQSWQKRCKVELVRGLSLDLTPTLSAQLQKIHSKVAARIDRELRARLPLRAHANALWRNVQRNHSLAEGLTLQLRPQKIGAGALTVKDDRLQMQVELRAKPRVFWKHRPQPVKPRPLPRLAQIKHPQPKIDGHIELILPLDAVAQAAGQQLQRSGFAHLARGLKLRGLGRRVELSVAPPGGTALRLSARPRWDGHDTALYLADVQSSAATDTPEPAILSSHGVLQGLAGRLRYQPRAELARAQTRLEGQLNFKQRAGNLTLQGRGQVQQFAIERVAMGPQGLHIALHLKARWTLALSAG